LIPYELPNGRTVMLTIDQILNLDDLAIQDMMAKNLGMEILDPFANLDFREFQTKEHELPSPEEIEPLDEDSIKKIKDEIDKDK
jgi:hypothetical protein